MQTQKEITVGQIWEEVDPRLIRKVRVVEVASLEGPKGILIENVESGRKNWASSSRFNGKRGGYRFPVYYPRSRKTFLKTLLYQICSLTGMVSTSSVSHIGKTVRK